MTRLPSDLAGSYQLETDHLRFSARIPDAFPFISFSAERPEDVQPLAVLIEEFVHRCQMAATSLGLLYRMGSLAQVRESLRLLRRLAQEPAARVATPWLSASVVEDSDVAHSLSRIKALEVLRRLLLGVHLGCTAGEARDSMGPSRASLSDRTPLRFGTFGLWDLTHDPLYREDGSPVVTRSTRAILESHASAYAAELIRASSPARAGAWVDDHIRANRLGLYKALEDISAAADVPLPSLASSHLLKLADWSLSGDFTDIPGFIPPPDYIESALPYSRYSVALRDLHNFATAVDRLRDAEPEKYGHLTAEQRLNLIVDVTVRTRGQASPLFGLPKISPRPTMEAQIARTYAWDAEQREPFGQRDPAGYLEHLIIGSITYVAVRYFKILAEVDTGAAVFAPIQDRFVLLARFCDWPVIEYPDGLEIFLCDPMSDPTAVIAQQSRTYQLLVAVRNLITKPWVALQAPDLQVGRSPLHEQLGVRAAQLAAT